MKTRHNLALLFGMFLLTASVASNASYVGECGSLDNAYGPFDYRNPDTSVTRLPSVEAAHFTIEVENLQRGKTATMPGPDIAYILKAFPNHHRALYAMGRYGIKHSAARPPGSNYSVDCWFERAKRFRPDDGIVWLVSGIYNFKRGELEVAEQEYLQAIAKMPENAEPYYNLGLLYLAQSRFSEARHNARQAYELGHPLQGLKNRLISVGHWVSE